MKQLLIYIFKVFLLIRFILEKMQFKRLKVSINEQLAGVYFFGDEQT